MIIQHNKSQDGKSKVHNVVDKIEVDLENRMIKQISHGISRTIFPIVKYVTNTVELLKQRKEKNTQNNCNTFSFLMVMSEFKSSNFACEKCRRKFCKGCVNTIKYVPVICSLFLYSSKRVSPVPPVNKVI